MGKKETKKAFFTIGNFDLSNSNSKEPSNTIKISPMVPSIGSNEERSGTTTLKKTVSCLMTQPKRSNKITEGILVLAELRSNKYANKIRIHSVMMIDVVIPAI